MIRGRITSISIDSRRIANFSVDALAGLGDLNGLQGSGEVVILPLQEYYLLTTQLAELKTRLLASQSISVIPDTVKSPTRFELIELE